MNGMFRFLLLLFILLPITELVILLQVHQLLAAHWGHGLSLLITVSTIIVTGILGAALARQQGLSVIRDIRQHAGVGRMPGQPLMDGALVLIGAALLLTPGYLSDLIGLSLLIPVSRAGYRSLLRRWLQHKFQTGDWKANVFRNGEPVFNEKETVNPSAGSGPREVEARVVEND